MTINSVAVLGAGHGGFAAAADLTRRGYEVRLQARSEARLRPVREGGGITARGIFDGQVLPALLTTDVGEAIEGADLIMLVVPSLAHSDYARWLAPFMSPDRTVFLDPGHTGGGMHFVHELRAAGYRGDVRTCETTTLTYICRKEGPAEVGIYSYTTQLKFSAFPGRYTEGLYEAIKPLFPEIVPAASVLETGLANINAIFHPPGMLMNAGRIEQTGGHFLFYREGFTDSIGRVTQAVDDERLAVALALGIPAVPFIEYFQKAGLTTAAAAASGSDCPGLPGKRAQRHDQEPAVARSSLCP